MTFKKKLPVFVHSNSRLSGVKPNSMKNWKDFGLIPLKSPTKRLN